MLDQVSAMTVVEDPLAYLRRTPIQTFPKRHTIYDCKQPSEHLYLVVDGRVKVINTSWIGCVGTVRVVSVDGLFGESCLIDHTANTESAVTLEKVMVMRWTREDIEQQIVREPHLGLALCQVLAQKCLALQTRIENISRHKTPERVRLALLQLAADIGMPLEDGLIRVASLTHTTIAEYVGTSREVVSHEMNRLRRMGLLRYSRKYIDIDVQRLPGM